ncbi:hypothetical protein VUR80DRAFT_8327 [Thermomyces stellatus]
MSDLEEWVKGVVEELVGKILDMRRPSGVNVRGEVRRDGETETGGRSIPDGIAQTLDVLPNASLAAETTA